MSSNNLGRNLDWLLSTKPFLPPAASLSPLQEAVTQLPSRGAGIPSPLEPSQLGSNVEAATEESGNEYTEDRDSTIDPQGREDAMAKLCSAPTTSRRPQLLVHEPEQSREVTQSKSAARSPLRIKATRNIHDPDPIIKTHSSSPMKSPRKARFLAAIDTVDLTGDEDAATDRDNARTPAPLMSKLSSIVKRTAESPFKTSRKRKSEEYEKDLHPKGRTSVGFTSIEDVPVDPPPPYSTSVLPPVEDISAFFSESSDEQEHEIRQAESKPKHGSRKHNSEREEHLQQSPSAVRRTGQRVMSSSREARLVRSTPKPQIAATISTPSKSRRPRRTVADSEEDSDLTDEKELQSNVNIVAQSPHLVKSGPLTLDGQNRDTTSRIVTLVNDKDFARTPAFARQDESISAFSTPRLASNNATRPQQHFQSTSRTIVESIAQPLASSGLETFKDSDPLFRVFAEWSQADVQTLLDSAVFEHEQWSKLFADALFETGDPESPEVVEANDSATAAKLRKEQIQQLLEARQKHHDKSDRKRDLHKQVVAEQQRGGNIDFEHVRAVTKSLRENEARIVTILKETALDVHSFTKSQQDDISGVAVKSTQAGPIRALSTKPNNYPATLATYPQTQFVRQTQGASSGGRSYPDDELHAAYSETQLQYNKNNMRESRTRGITTPRNTYTTSREQVINMPPDENFDDDDFEDDEEALFDTHMGSPPATRVDGVEAYDVEDDDADMLEAIEDLEAEPPVVLSRAHLNHREALLESSGNSIRAPSIPKQHKAPLSTSRTSVTTAATAMLQYPWSAEVKAGMFKKFHLRGFRQNQLEAINATLDGQDVFVLMPTGGGKSLCYQLPAIIRSGKTRGLTIVVSPLLSLMEDQISHLRKLNIQAQYINGEVSAAERSLVMGALKDPKVDDLIQLLYITPEMLSKNLYLVDLLRNLGARGRLARFVIDEAHCVSQWGHDFRPDYKALGEIRQQFVGVPFMALTATATQNVKADVIHNLHLENCKVFAQSFNRPNLFYEVRPKLKAKELIDAIAGIITSKYMGQSGIVYCLSRKKCEEVAQQLSEMHRIKAHHYHAGMEPAEKSFVQKEWQAGKYQVIVATIAFGMGIDKPDVRFVIHHSIPKSLEGYYQETGRAGRDGKRSGCYLFWGYQDFMVLKRMIEDGDGGREQIQRGLDMLRNVVQFCENKSDCRRVQVLHYFSERFQKEDCNGGCDNCNSTSTFELVDFTEYAKQAARLVRQLNDQKVTLMHCVDVFRGAKGKKIVDLGHDQFDEHGFGKDLDRNEVERLFYRLIGEDVLLEKTTTNRGGFPTQHLHTGRNRMQYEKGTRRLELQVRTSPTTKRMRPPDIGAKPSKKKAVSKTGTGVKASRNEYPMSTNVSSPPKGASKRRLAQYQYHESDEDEDDAFETGRLPTRTSKTSTRVSTGYRKDGFVVSDQIDPDDFEEDDGIFAPVREVGKPQKKRKSSLPPRITIDERMQPLTKIHRDLVDEFITYAHRENEKLMFSKNLRAAPFTDTMLTEMAIKFPKNKQEMLRIPGIDPDKVELYHHKFLGLIRSTEKRYHELSNQQEDRPNDPNHQNVIDLMSDIDDEAGEAAEGLGSSQEEQSSYFQQPDSEVLDFNNQMQQLQSNRLAQRPRPTPSVPPPDEGGGRPNRGGGESSGKRTSFRKPYRKSGGGYGGDGASSHFAAKKRGGGTGATRKASGGKPSRSAAGQRSFATGGIGMMPT